LFLEKHFSRCSSCKDPIDYGAEYFTCSISTCKNTAYCSLGCFDAHVPIFRHKDAWAEKRIAPKEGNLNIAKEPISMVDRSVASAKKGVLVVASKLKEYIKSQSGMNTSAAVLETVSEVIRKKCDDAIAKAKADGRKTVMERDFS